MAAKSFIEILEDEIRNDLRREIEAELLARSPEAQAKAANAAASGRFEAWLASHVGGPKTFKVARKPYGPSTATRPVAAQATIQAPAKTKTPATAAELFAVELLNRHSTVRLGASFTEDELKTAWRKAAMKSHPDRFAGEDQITVLRMTALFRELSEAYATLCDLFATQAA